MRKSALTPNFTKVQLVSKDTKYLVREIQKLQRIGMYNKKFPIHTIVISKSKTGQQYITQVVVQNLHVGIL